MAASRKRVSSSSSSEDDGEMQRLKEAAWSFSESNGMRDTITSGDSKDQPSRRINVSQHEHDGNELQTTPEFRTHVAKKLGSILDSCISESTSTGLQRTARLDPEEEEDDDGFRLFSTSVPGQENLNPPTLRRPIPSSSDSDSEMEMRLREAAVSVGDFLPTAPLPSRPQPSSLPVPFPTENQSKRKKKKKKKKKKARDGSEVFEEESGGHVRKGMQVDREGEAQTCSHGRSPAGTQGALKAPFNSTPLQDQIPVKKKKKKKKMRSEVEG